MATQKLTPRAEEKNLWLSAFWLVCRGQILFFIGMAACTILTPQFAFSRDQGGVSNYGVHARTIAASPLLFGDAACLPCALAI